MDDNYLKVIDKPHLVRDKKSKAILNNDLAMLNKYKEEREEKAKISRVINEFDSVKNDVSEIKAMLQQLLKKE